MSDYEAALARCADHERRIQSAGIHGIVRDIARQMATKDPTDCLHNLAILTEIMEARHALALVTP